MAKRGNFSPDFKARVALAAIHSDGTIAKLVAWYQVHTSMIGTWKRTALEGLKTTFTRGRAVRMARDREEEITRLQAKIGELVVERECACLESRIAINVLQVKYARSVPKILRRRHLNPPLLSKSVE